MPHSPPITVAEFKARFVRDFKYGSGPDQVMDSDLNVAFTDALTAFNPALFSTEDGKTAFLYASAHFLVTNVQAVGGLQAKPEGLGIENQAEHAVSSKSVSGISISYVDIPDIVKKSVILRQFWKTEYGKKYLAMLTPKLVGPFSAILGPKPPDAGVSPNVPFTDL